MAGGERAAHETVRHDRQAAARGRRQLLHASPRPVDALVEDRPGLAVWRRVVWLEHVEAELRVGPTAKIAEVSLSKQWLHGERRAGGALQRLRRRHGAGVVGRDDTRDTLAREALRQPLGLRDAARRQRDVRVLNDPERIALGLAVTDQEESAHREGSQTVASAAGRAVSTSRRHARTRAMLASAFAGTSPRETCAMNASRLVAIRSEALTSSWSACTRRVPRWP